MNTDAEMSHDREMAAGDYCLPGFDLGLGECWACHWEFDNDELELDMDSHPLCEACRENVCADCGVWFPSEELVREGTTYSCETCIAKRKKT